MLRNTTRCLTKTRHSTLFAEVAENFRNQSRGHLRAKHATDKSLALLHLTLNWIAAARERKDCNIRKENEPLVRAREKFACKYLFAAFDFFTVTSYDSCLSDANLPEATSSNINKNDGNFHPPREMIKHKRYQDNREVFPE